MKFKHTVERRGKRFPEALHRLILKPISRAHTRQIVREPSQRRPAAPNYEETCSGTLHEPLWAPLRSDVLAYMGHTGLNVEELIP